MNFKRNTVIYCVIVLLSISSLGSVKSWSPTELISTKKSTVLEPSSIKPELTRNKEKEAVETGAGRDFFLSSFSFLLSSGFSIAFIIWMIRQVEQGPFYKKIIFAAITQAILDRQWHALIRLYVDFLFYRQELRPSLAWQNWHKAER